MSVWRKVFGLALVLATVGCEQLIGDPCDTAADCTTGTDRLCDRTLPGGYCTIFNCEPGGCPEEAVCVAFRTSSSTQQECANEQRAARLQRTFCMKACSSDRDCRSGYACLDLSEFDPEENPWAAQVIDRRSAQVCAVPYSGPLPGDERQAEVCSAGPFVPDGSSATSGAAASDAGLDASGAPVLGSGG